MFSLSVQWLWLVLQRFPLMMTLNSLSFLLFGENSENERTADIILQIHVNLSFLFTNPNYWEIRKLVNSDRALIDQNSQFNIQYSIFNIHISIFTLFIIQYHKFTNPVAIKWPVHPTSWDNQNLDHVWTRVWTDHTYSLLAWLLSRVAKCNWNSMTWHFATRLLCRVEANMQPPLSPTSILQHFSTEQKSKESLHWFGISLCHFRPLCLRRFQFWLSHLSHIVSSFKMVPFFFVALQTCLSCSCCSDGREDGGRTHFLRSDNFHQKLPNFGLNKTKVW